MRSIHCILGLVILALDAFPPLFAAEFTLEPDGYHVRPGQNIQAALDAAAGNVTQKVVRVHAGVYGPTQPGLALIWLNRRHDAIRLEAVGEVTLTAVNPALTDPRHPGHPAAVNHVVYLGDGLTNHTVVTGFRITGANHFVSTNAPEVIEPNLELQKGLFFYCDGGAIKIFGRSYPTLRNLEIVDNYASPCAGGISVEHDGHGPGGSPGRVVIENCIFRNNTAQVTGAAVDLLPGSSALIKNCLFVGNAANTGVNYIDPNQEQPAFTNSAPLTVFPGSRVIVLNSTFTGNRNAVDDFGVRSVFRNSVFWSNDRSGGFYTTNRYDVEFGGKADVSGCFFGGPIVDAHGVVSSKKNTLNAPDPDFDEHFVPRSKDYEKAGYRGIHRPHFGVSP